MWLKSISSLVLLFSTQLLIGNTATQLAAEDQLMPYGWIAEQIDWTDAAHIWDQKKAIQLAERGPNTAIFATPLWGPFGSDRQASLVLTTDCDNVIDPGTIGFNQEFCEPNSDPEEIVSISPAGGGSGNLEYIWLKKEGNGPWETIIGSTGASYDPGPLSVSTFFRRCARRTGCEEYIETDIVHISFNVPAILVATKKCGEAAGTYTVDLTISNATVVMANGERIYSPYLFTAPLGTAIEVSATGSCGTVALTITDEGLNCLECPQPAIAIALGGDNPVCSDDNETYTLNFSVTDANAVFVNDVLQAGTGPDFTITLPAGQNAGIVATNQCGEQVVQVSQEVEAPTCPIECPRPTIIINTTNNPACNPDSLSYTLQFTVTDADAVFVNDVLQAGTGPDFSITLPAGQRACIVATKQCDGQNLRASREVEAPICTPCPRPSITISTSGNPACNPDSLTYTLQFTVNNAEEVFVNNELQVGTGPDFTITLPVDQNASILATKQCEGQTVRASRQVEAPDCPSDCTKPSILVNTPVCNPDSLTYTLQFTISNADEVFVNDELQAGSGPDFSITLPLGLDAQILARKQCNSLTKEAAKLVKAPTCIPCPKPNITINTINNPACNPDSLTYTLHFSVSDADEVFVNDVLQAGTGPDFTITLPTTENARILARNQCDGQTEQASRQVEAPNCETGCTKPTIVINTTGNPSCNPDGQTYTLQFTVNGADSVYLNELLLEGTGPDFTVMLPVGIRACIVATKQCGNRTERAAREVDSPNCTGECPTPTVSIAPDGDPRCSEDNLSYSFDIIVNGADSVFVNGDLQAGTGPNFTITLPAGQDATIVARKRCDDQLAEATLTVTAPQCPPCPTPEVSIAPDGDPRCSEDNLSYSFDIIVNGADSVFVNGNLQAGTGPNFTITLPAGQDATIVARKRCDDQLAEATLEVKAPQCPPCPAPEVSIAPDGDPRCSEDNLSYSFDIIVNGADSVFVNGDLQAGTGPNFTITLPAGQDATIVARKRCDDQLAEATLEVKAPQCPPCPAPEVSIAPDGDPRCSEDNLSYSFDIIVNGADSVFVNGDLQAGTGPNFTITLPAGQDATIVARKRCDDQLAEATLEVKAPQCPPCPAPEVSIAPDGDPRCSEDNLSYSFDIIVNGADSVFVNGDLQAGTGPNFTITLPAGQDATIVARKRCDDQLAEATLEVKAPQCPPCPAPEVSIAPDGDPRCSEDNLSYSFDIIVNGADSVFVNGNLQAGTGPNFTITLPAGQDATIVARKRCDDQLAEATLEVKAPQCPPCPTPEVSIAPDGDPRCSEDNLSYSFDIIVNGADSVFVNGDLQAGTGPNFTITLPAGQDATIVARKRCDDQLAEATLEVKAPQCPPCPAPEVSIAPDGDPRCSEDNLSYSFDIIVNGADSVFVNGDLQAGTGPNFTITLPAGQDATIVARKRCDDQLAETTLEVKAPQCPPCPAPEVSIAPDGDPRCSEDNLSYSFDIIVNGADSVFVNGDLQAGTGPNFTITLPAGQDATIVARKRCDDQLAEAILNVTAPQCPPCPIPTVNVTVDDNNPACNADGETYTVNFSVDNEPDSVFVNGVLQAGNGPDFSITIPLTEVANIRAVKTCGDQVAEDNETVNPPDCCPKPDINVTVDDNNPACNADGETYTVNFSVDKEPDSVFVNGVLQAGNGPDFSITLPLTEVANIRAVKICGDQVAEDNETVNPPDCCPKPDINVTVDDNNPDCNADRETYTVNFSVDNEPDSVFVNGVLQAGNGPDFSITLPLTEVANIRAVKICGDQVAEDNETVNPPDCPCITVDLKDANICEGQTATLSPTLVIGGTPPYTFAWFDNPGLQGAPIGTDSVLHNVTAGTYYLLVDDQAEICPAVKDSATVTLIQLPVITEVDTVCGPESGFYTITFSATNADIVTANGNPLTPDAAGRYTYTSRLTLVKLIAKNECGEDNAEVTPGSLDCCDLFVTLEGVSICEGDTARLAPVVEDGDPAYMFEWFDNATYDGNPISTDSVYQTTVAGTYYLRVKDQDPKCDPVLDSAVVTIRPLPSLEVNTTCAPEAGVYEACATVLNATSVSASINGGELILLTDAPYCVSAAFADTITFFVSNECGADTMMVTSEGLDCCNLLVTLEDTSFCEGDTLKLAPTVAGGVPAYSFAWYANDDYAGDPIGTDSVLIAPGPGTYYLEVDDQDILCPPFRTSATITITPEPGIILLNKSCGSENGFYTIVFTASDATTVTANDNVLTAQDGQYSYSAPTGTLIVIVASNECGADTVEVNSDDLDCCVLEVTITSSAPDICPGDIVTLTANASGGEEPYTYIWTRPGQQDTVAQSITVTDAGTYSVFVSSGSCTPAEASITVNEGQSCLPCPAVIREQIFFPTAFSPNGDGINEQLRLVFDPNFDPSIILELRIEIYNRWGERLKTIKTVKDTWDGTFRGKKLPPDVYAYYFFVKCRFSEETFQEKGNVTILK
ncbi:MAG: T9SS type B sorting domain-containing protein [Saprospiraceae bacterium]